MKEKMKFCGCAGLIKIPTWGGGSVPKKIGGGMCVAFVSMLLSNLSEAALTITIREDEMGVTVSTSGSVNLSNLFILNQVENAVPLREQVVFGNNLPVYEQHFSTPWVTNTRSTVIGGTSTVPEGFEMSFIGQIPIPDEKMGSLSGFFLGKSELQSLVIMDDGVTAGQPITNRSFAHEASYTLSNRTLTSLGLSSHEKNTNISLWQNPTVIGDAGTIQFRVEAIPEPSVALLCGLSVLGMWRRRRVDH